MPYFISSKIKKLIDFLWRDYQSCSHFNLDDESISIASENDVHVIEILNTILEARRPINQQYGGDQEPFYVIIQHMSNTFIDILNLKGKYWFLSPAYRSYGLFAVHDDKPFVIDICEQDDTIQAILFTHGSIGINGNPFMPIHSFIPDNYSKI